MDNFFKSWLFDPTVGKIVSLLVGIVVIISLVRLIQRYLSRYLKDTDTRYRVRKFITFLGYIVGIIFVATVFSGQLGGITVALGVAGAGIAFALQEVIASIAGWFAISFAKFYKTGDRVQLGGIKGDIIDIGILRTTLMECGQWVNGDLYNGRVVRIANSFIFKEPVFNYSGDFPFLWDEIVIPVRYGSDIRLAREIINRVATELLGQYAANAKTAWKEMVSKFMIEDASVDPAVSLIANDNWVEFSLRYVVDYKLRRITKDRLFTNLLEEIEKTNGRVTLASATFEVVGIPPVNVRLNRDQSQSNP